MRAGGVWLLAAVVSAGCNSPRYEPLLDADPGAPPALVDAGARPQATDGQAPPPPPPPAGDGPAPPVPPGPDGGAPAAVTDARTPSPDVRSLGDQFLYISSGNVYANFISRHAVAPDGTLGGPLESVPTSDYAYTMAADPKGRFLFVLAAADGTMFQYRINPDGSLDANGSHPGLLGTRAVTHPGGNFLYVMSHGPEVRQLVIGADGRLTANSPAAIDVPPAAGDIGFSADGRFAYVVSTESNVVSQFSVTAGGSLAALSPPTVSVGGPPRRIAVSRAGAFAFVSTDGTNGIWQYRVGADGKLTPNNPPSAANELTPSDLQLSPDGRYLYLAHTQGFSQYAIDPNGRLALSPPALATTSDGRAVSRLAIDLTGRFAFAMSYNGSILPVGIGPAGVRSLPGDPYLVPPRTGQSMLIVKAAAP